MTEILLNTHFICGFVCYHNICYIIHRVPLVEMELLTIRSTRVRRRFSEVLVPRSFVFCIVFSISLFVLFLLAIVLSVLRFTASVYLFGILTLFLHSSLHVDRQTTYILRYLSIYNID